MTQRTWLLGDTIESLRFSNFWFNSALFTFRASKSRFFLGYLHQPLSTIMLALFITFFLAGVFQKDQTSYFFYVLFGLSTWNFTSNVLIGSVDAIFKSRGVLKQIYLPFSAVVLKPIVVTCVGYLIELVVISAIYAIYMQSYDFLILYPLLIAVFSLLVVAFVLALGIAWVGNLMPDVSVVIPTVMRGAFFVTPIFWYVEDVGEDKQALMEYNPFYLFISLIRRAVFEAEIDLQSLAYIWGIVIVGLVGLAVLRFDRNKIIGRM